MWAETAIKKFTMRVLYLALIHFPPKPGPRTIISHLEYLSVFFVMVWFFVNIQRHPERCMAQIRVTPVPSRWHISKFLCILNSKTSVLIQQAKSPTLQPLKTNISSPDILKMAKTQWHPEPVVSYQLNNLQDTAINLEEDKW